MTCAGRVLLAAVIIAVAACGVRTDRDVVVADPEDVPFGLLEEEPTETTVVTGNATEVTICLWDGDRLKEVRTGGSAEAAETLALLASPPRDEATRLLSTAVFEPAIFRSVSVTAGVARVDLAATFTEADATAQRAVIAQAVCTLTARPGIGQVEFTLDGTPIAVPRGDGSTTTDRVTREDYAGLL